MDSALTFAVAGFTAKLRLMLDFHGIYEIKL
jgi:hypothetical protein